MICKILIISQLTIKTIDDLRLVGNENLTLKMYIMQLIHLKDLDSKSKKKLKMNYHKKSENFVEKNLNNLKQDEIKSNKIMSIKKYKSSKNRSVKKFKYLSQKIEITNFQDLIDQCNKERKLN